MKRGFVAITTVLIISVVVVAISMTVFLTSINESQSSFSVVNGEQSLQFAEGCMEDVMLHVHDDASYAASDMAYPEGVCRVSASRNGTVWTVETYADANEYSRHVRVSFDRTLTEIVVLSWTEV